MKKTFQSDMKYSKMSEHTIEIFEFEVFNGKKYHVILETKLKDIAKEFIKKILDSKCNDDIELIKTETVLIYIAKYEMNKNEYNTQPGSLMHILEKISNELMPTIEMKRRDDIINDLIG